MIRRATGQRSCPVLACEFTDECNRGFCNNYGRTHFQPNRKPAIATIANMSSTSSSPQLNSCSLSLTLFQPGNGAEGCAMSHATSSASATMFGYSRSPAHCNEQLKHFGSLSHSSGDSDSYIRVISSLARCRRISGMGSTFARISVSRSVSGTPSFIASAESNSTMWPSGSSSRPKGLLLINQLILPQIVYSRSFGRCCYEAITLVEN